jgi:hypothetical protein
MYSHLSFFQERCRGAIPIGNRAIPIALADPARQPDRPNHESVNFGTGSGSI